MFSKKEFGIVSNLRFISSNEWAWKKFYNLEAEFYSFLSDYPAFTHQWNPPKLIPIFSSGRKVCNIKNARQNFYVHINLES